MVVVPDLTNQNAVNKLEPKVDLNTLDKIKAEFDATKREEALRARGIEPKAAPQAPPPDVGAAKAPM